MNRIGLIALFVFMSLGVISLIAAGRDSRLFSSDSRDSVAIRNSLSVAELARMDSVNCIYDPV